MSAEHTKRHWDKLSKITPDDSWIGSAAGRTITVGRHIYVATKTGWSEVAQDGVTPVRSVRMHENEGRLVIETVEIATGIYPKWSDGIEHEYVSEDVALGRSAEGLGITSFFGLSGGAFHREELHEMRETREPNGLPKLTLEQQEAQRKAIEQARNFDFGQSPEDDDYDPAIYDSPGNKDPL